MPSSLGAPNGTVSAFFFVFVAATLTVTSWAARRMKTTRELFAAGSKITGFQSGHLPRVRDRSLMSTCCLFA